MKALIPSGQKIAVKFIFYAEDNLRNQDENFFNLSYTEEKNADHVLQRRWNISQVVLMTDAMANFIGTHCYCYYCRKKTSKSLQRCNCGNQNSIAIHVISPDSKRDEYGEIFSALWHKEWVTRRQENRRLKLNGAGKHTKKEVEALLDVQQEHCAYCASSLRNHEGRLVFHKDHYVPLDHGGTNELSNLLITCPTCNMQKANFDAPSFIRKKSRQLTQEQRELAKGIRADVKAYKKRSKNPPIY